MVDGERVNFGAGIRLPPKAEIARIVNRNIRIRMCCTLNSGW
jgi:hypothetical protein